MCAGVRGTWENAAVIKAGVMNVTFRVQQDASLRQDIRSLSFFFIQSQDVINYEIKTLGAGLLCRFSLEDETILITNDRLLFTLQEGVRFVFRVRVFRSLHSLRITGSS